MGAVLAAAVGYIGYMGMEGSHRLVNLYQPKTDCRTPAQIGLVYEAINYDIATDEALAEREPDMERCSAPGVAPGDELVSNDGVRLAGWYIPSSRQASADGPTVVLAHGWGDNKSGMLGYVPFFIDRYNVVLFDFRNHNQSADSQTTQGITEQRDLVAVLDWLETTKGPELIVLWGESMGGHTAANVAASDPRVDALILDSTHDRVAVPMAARIRNAGYPFGEVGYLAVVAGAWLRTGVDVTSADPVAAVDDLGTRPLLLVHSGADDTIPLDSARALERTAAEAGVDVRLEVCAGSPHGEINTTCPDEYLRWLSDFLDPLTG